jgi:hypothetical protein
MKRLPGSAAILAALCGPRRALIHVKRLYEKNLSRRTLAPVGGYLHVCCMAAAVAAAMRDAPR